VQFFANRKLSHLTTAAMVAFVVLTAAALFAVVSLQTRSDVQTKALAQLQSNVRTFVGILRGSIDSFGIFPIAFNQQGRATQYQISITANIELLDHKNDDKVMWKNDQYRFTENYQVNIESTDAFDQETRAIQDIAVQFAQSLVTNLLEGF